MILQRLRIAVLAAALSLGLPGASIVRAQESVAVEAPRQVLVFLRLPPQHYRPGGAYGGGYGDSEGRSARRRIAARIAGSHGLQLVSDWPMPSLSVDCFVMAVPGAQTVEQASERLAQDPDVLWSQPVQLFHGESAAAVPNDPLYRTQPVASAWRLAELHRISTGRRVRVAVIDSMVDASHPDLAGQIETAQNFVLDAPRRPERHGTAVAGIIAARSDNGVGIAGVAPQARLLALRACWETMQREAVCDSLSLARALDFAIAHRVQVINMSLSGPPDPLLSRLLELSFTRGIVVVAAVDRDAPGGGFPASFRGVVAVASNDRPAPRTMLVAPGRDVPTTQPGGRWSLVNGSSYAAAHVSGLFALLRERLPVIHSPMVAAVAYSGEGIDACATLLQRAGSCD